MTYSPHQLAYFAHQLTRRAASNSMDRMAGALLDAQVDLNPHQIDAALFATSNPLSRGAILADEVGLGKTIEAGLLIAQKWAERKRRIPDHHAGQPAQAVASGTGRQVRYRRWPA
jgi:SNF2 family DNA or RNA helicase